MAYWNDPDTWQSTGPVLSASGEVSVIRSQTALTPCTQGTPVQFQMQSYNLGAAIQSRYLKRTSTSHLGGVNQDLYFSDQSLIRVS